MGGPVVVGYDGSGAALEALGWALLEARRERLPVRVVHVSELESGVLAEAMEQAATRAPDVSTTAVRLLRDSVPAALLEEAEHAHALVLGSRGRGGFTGLLLGSVSAAVAAHARCPVVVVRPTPTRVLPHVRPVVVGVDGSATSGRAIDLAFDHASWLRVPLVAVHAWRLPAPVGTGASWRTQDITDLRVAQDALLAESLAGRAERYPDVEVRPVVRRGAAAETVLAVARDAQLLVVGSRGRGGFQGLLLGSVSRAVLHHASCPVVVVHPG